MDLAKELLAPKDSGCILARYMDTRVAPEHREALQQALDMPETDPRFKTGAELEAILKAGGYEVTRRRITDHRGGRCSCAKTGEVGR